MACNTGASATPTLLDRAETSARPAPRATRRTISWASRLENAHADTSTEREREEAVEEEGAGAEEIFERLDAIGTLPEDATLADLFNGRPVPCVHKPLLSPFPRYGRFEHQSCHYVPGKVGDSLTASLYTALESAAQDKTPMYVAQGSWATPYAYEMRSLVPAISYMWDLRESTRELTQILAAAQSSGEQFPGDAADVATRALAIAVQSDAVFEHLNERLGVIATVAEGDEVETEILGRIYGQERRRAGAMSLLEQGVRDTVATKEITSLTAKSAREKAKSLSLAHGLRPQPLPQPPPFRWGGRGARARGGGRGPTARNTQGGKQTSQTAPTYTAPRSGAASPPSARTAAGAAVGGAGPSGATKGGGKGGGGKGGTAPGKGGAACSFGCG